MKRIIIFLTIISFSILPATAYNMLASLSYAVFNTPDSGPYIETYLVVQGKTLTHIQLEDGNFQGALDIQILFKKNDSIVNFGKYELLGPSVKDTSKITNNLLDVQRYALPKGDYQMELSILDRYSEQDTIVTRADFSIDYDNEKMAFSDIELLHSFKKAENDGILVKSGYELIPYVFDFYPEVAQNLSFYAELYNSDKKVGNDAFLLYYYLRPFEVDKKMDQYFYMKRINGEPVNILLNTIDISQLPSGNYYLVLETRDRNNELLNTSKKFFQRHNPNAQFNLNNLLVIDTENSFANEITSRDSLILYIDYLYPISTEMEKIFAKNFVKEASVEDLQKYFLNFWTDRNPIDPESNWMDYKMRVSQANYEFKSVRVKGYRTDRGRVYLQYGQPNVRTPSINEPAAYPYEIWHYYELQGQRDKKFVFYTRDLATNDFQLIHSNAIGEIANYRWQTIIYSRTWDPYSIDESIMPRTYGSFATDYYLQPR